MRCWSFLIGAAASLVVGGTAGAQGTTPGVRAEVVRLDVAVSDAEGEPVLGLKREDFEVLEDGRPQRLTGFYATGGGATAPTSAEEQATSSVALPAPARRVAIVVDELHLSQRSVGPVRDVLRRFLAEVVAPQDEVALVVAGSPEATVQPTRDRAALRQAIARITPRRDAIVTGQGAQLTPEQAEQILRGELGALKLATRLLMDEPGSLLSGSIVPKNMSSDPLPAGIDPDEKAAALEVERQSRRVLGEALSISEASLWTIEHVLRGMAPLPGRKLCLLVSDGFLVGRGTSEERIRHLRQVIDAATRSGVAIYPLLAAGLAPIGSDAAVVGGAGPAGLRDRVARLAEQQRLETLEGLADDTGGFVLRGGDAIATGLVRMMRDALTGYLLAYEPSNTRRNGHFRKVEVRVPGHREYVVRTRRGYFAPRSGKHARREMSRTAPRPLSMIEAQLALGASPPPDGIPVRMAADYLELAPGGPHAIVKAQVEVAGLAWEETEGRQRTAFDLVGGVYDESGAPVGPPFVGHQYVFDLTGAQRRELEESGVRLQTLLPLRPGRYQIRLLALDSAGRPLGGATRPLEVPDLADKALTLSGIFLSSSAAAGPGSGSEEPRDAQVLRRFRTSDTLYFQVYVYNASRDATGTSDVVLQAQIRPAAGRPFASRPRPVLLLEKDGALLPEAGGVPLTSLVPGSYELRIVVVDKKADATAARSVDFTVVG